jgi:hypothetical protein
MMTTMSSSERQAATELWYARTREGAHEDENERHRRLPHTLVKLQDCSMPTEKWRRSGSVAAV